MTKFTNRKEIRYVCGNRLGFHIFIISACSRNVKYILTKIRSCARQLFARCRRGDSRARRRTPDPYRLSLKWHAPIASVAALSERHADWQLLRYAFCGVKLSDLSLRGGRRPTWRPEREARGSALGVQSREGSCDFAEGFPTIRLCTARLPRRFAPRNDTSGEREVHQCPSAIKYSLQGGH